jgi:hypothetical protein
MSKALVNAVTFVLRMIDMTTKRTAWPRGALKLIMGRAENTGELAPYEFQDDSEPTAPPELSIQEWTQRCRLAATAVEIERAGLIEAQNQVVQCQGALMKAETLLERQQQGFLECASKIPGVPCFQKP